jgi:polyhydroxyalkanoate synthesis regulator phasin
MIDIIKKTLLAGLGAAVITKDTVEHALGDWIERGKITPEEAKGFATKLVAAGEGTWTKTKEEAAQQLDAALKKTPFATRAAHDTLAARVSVLEQILLRDCVVDEATGTAGNADAGTAEADTAAAGNTAGTVAAGNTTGDAPAV